MALGVSTEESGPGEAETEFVCNGPLATPLTQNWIEGCLYLSRDLPTTYLPLGRPVLGADTLCSPCSSPA